MRARLVLQTLVATDQNKRLRSLVYILFQQLISTRREFANHCSMQGNIGSWPSCSTLAERNSNCSSIESWSMDTHEPNDLSASSDRLAFEVTS